MVSVLKVSNWDFHLKSECHSFIVACLCFTGQRSLGCNEGGYFSPHYKAAPLEFVNAVGFADPPWCAGNRGGTSSQCQRCRLMGPARGCVLEGFVGSRGSKISPGALLPCRGTYSRKVKGIHGEQPTSPSKLESQWKFQQLAHLGWVKMLKLTRCISFFLIIYQLGHYHCER